MPGTATWSTARPEGVGLARQVARNPKSYSALAAGRRVTEAKGRPEDPGEIVVAATAQDARRTLAGGPGRTIRRGAFKCRVPAVLDPVVAVAVDLIEPPWIGFEEIDRHG